MDCQIEISGATLKLTHLEKPYWPGITKGDLLAYWQKLASVALPLLAGRPLSLVRYPHGWSGQSFWQKNLPSTAPQWLSSYLHEGKTRYLVADSPAALLWAVNQGAIELHPWASKVTAPSFPDYAILDLDPLPQWGFSQAREAASAARRLADELGLRLYPKTSGASGLHLYLPLVNRYPYPVVTGFMEKFCQIIANALPELATVERLVKNRQGKVYLDYLQNLPGKTIVAAFCPRAVKGATVSWPLSWEELADAEPQDFTIRTVPKLAPTEPWPGVLAGQTLEGALERLELIELLRQIPHSGRLDSKAETQPPPVPAEP